MRLGIAIEETWDFFHEIYADLAEHHQTTLFKRRTVDLPFLNGRLNSFLFRQDLQAFLESNEVVFFEWASELLAVASHLPKRCGIVTRLHRYELYRWADQINWHAVDRIILVSREKQREFTERFPDQASKVVVIPEAISLRRFQPLPRPFSGNIGTLCHLRPRKRVYELILTFYDLARRREGLHLHIGGGGAAGAGDYQMALHALVKKLGLESRVTFHGHIDQPEKWYPNLDIFVSNSYSEGLQVAPMEAIASGCYCLSHRWDGAEELLPRENLYFTDSELIELVLRYADATEGEREQKRARLQAEVRERFNVDRTKVQIRQIIEEVASSGEKAVGFDSCRSGI